jgi:hypothetical protein
LLLPGIEARFLGRPARSPVDIPTGLSRLLIIKSAKKARQSCSCASLIKHYAIKAYDLTYRSTFSWPRHYLKVSGQLHAPAALLPVPTGYEAGWAPVPVWTLWRENSWPYRDSKSDPPCRPAGSQSLYRLRYPGSHYNWNDIKK